MELRPYQQAAVTAIEEGWRDGSLRKSLLVLPTGTGKTVVFCTVARQTTGDGRVLILAHREELIEQAREKYYRITGEIAAKEKAHCSCFGDPASVVVGSVQTLQNVKRLSKFPADYFSTIIIDEAHHALAVGYQRVLEHFPRARVLGVTATPDRGDKRNLAEYFDGVAYEYSLKSAIADGYLCPIRALTAPLRLDVSNVKTSRSKFGNDFDRAELSVALEEYLPQIAQCIKENASARKTVVFLPLVSIAQQFQRECEAAGLEAREVNGESDNRAETLAWFDKAGPGSVLCNAMLLTEGWDCPSVDCVVVLRPTKVRALYCQMIGRGTRICPGKENLLILDFLWLSDKHDLCKPACLITDDEKAQRLIAQKSEDEQIDLMEAADEAEKEAGEETEKERRQSLADSLSEAMRHPKMLIDPLVYECFIGEKLDYEPTFKWEYLPVTEKQRAFLEKNGISTENLKRGSATRIIGDLNRRREAGLATLKQIRRLELYGYESVGDWSFVEAGARIDELTRAGWQKRRLKVSPEQYNRMRAFVDSMFNEDDSCRNTSTR
ncbi:DEAD/DEAH box helicase [Jonquetella anthropi]|uniref:DEAD/DEAH box helicase n=1 Tax=Jonquetella anthropi TaxID=428712 RepID=UPI0001B90F0A|nr:DEAD/DEAH box helicase [Jonquetella anthropi]EEX48658.1 helicase C-terminal domain protein [Jonquetella anthropi E3_33 E1]